MTIVYEERSSDSPYIETVMRGYTTQEGFTIRPAEIHWHMVFTQHNGRLMPLVVGPWSKAGDVSWGSDAEILWIKLKLGTFMPHLPIKNFLNCETILPDATGKSFWLNSSVWQFPNFENADTFVDHLVRDYALDRDVIVSAALQNKLPQISPRTIRYRFLRSTGLTQNHIRQVERAQQAVAYLRQGKSIMDTVFELGYFDQPHLTRALKQWIGHTPAQIIRAHMPK